MHQKKQIKYIGFDKDGTLIDSMSLYAREWGKILYKEYRIDEKEASEFLMQTAGQATSVQLDKLLSKHNINLSDKEIFNKANGIAELLGRNVKADLFPDVLPIFPKLKDKGYKIFVSSGQQEDIVKDDLERTGLIQFVDFYAGIKSKDPSYKKGESHFRAAANHFGILFETFVKETVFIGDTQTDIEVAKNSNILCIIRGGKTSEEKLKKLGARVIVEDFSKLPEIIASIN